MSHSLSAGHDAALVVLSVVIGTLASYTGLDLAGRVTAAAGRARIAWLAGSALAMGIGVWSMHFIGMLAFHLPVPVAYDVPLVLLSVAIAVAASGLALVVVSRPQVSAAALLVGACLMGPAIAGMHYVGMAAMRLPAALTYRLDVVALSVAIAVTASGAALWLLVRFRHDDTPRGRRLKAGSACLMGAAIAGMHYTGMAAARFTTHAAPAGPAEQYVLPPPGLAVAIVLAALLVLAVGLAGAVVDRWVRTLAAEAEALRRAQAALRQSEEHFRALIENADDLITVLDEDGGIRYESPSVTRTLGYHPGALLGTALYDVVHPDDVEAVRDAIARVVREPQASIAVEFRFRRADGSWRDLEARGTNLLAHPTVRGIVANSRDVTDRKAAEAALAARTAELKRSNAELEQFAYVASHDLQEPLRKIQAFGGRLVDRHGDAIGEQGRDYLARMQSAASRMQQLITDLLAFSRVTSKARPFAPVDLGQVAREVLGDLQARVETSGGSVELGALPVVHADPTQMRQLLQNLIGNALKFRRPDAPPHVALSAAVPRASPAAGTAAPLVELRVSDNGIGFDEKYLDRIFNPFQRLHGRTDYEGTGMGLAICRKIAERHGGAITARSRDGEGATFLVTLPLSCAGGPSTAGAN